MASKQELFDTLTEVHDLLMDIPSYPRAMETGKGKPVYNRVYRATAILNDVLMTERLGE